MWGKSAFNILINYEYKWYEEKVNQITLAALWDYTEAMSTCTWVWFKMGVFRFCLEISLSTWKCKKQCPLLSKAYQVALQYNSNNTEMLTNNETAHTKLTLTHLTFLIHFMPRFKFSPWKGFFKSSNFSDRKMTVKCHLCVGKG